MKAGLGPCLSFSLLVLHALASGGGAATTHL